MRIKNLKVYNSRLTEGNFYPFRILKTMELGDESYFVMQDPLGYKVLMPRHFYLDYGFEPGQTVQCRVDRINCNGRMYLEPTHPRYTEGNEYPFEVASAGTDRNMLDETEHFLWVKDVFNQQWKLRVWSEQMLADAGTFVNCRLERIKKGKLFLSLANEKPVHLHLEKGQRYPFTIVEERINPTEKTAYFILTDGAGRKHPLKKKYYTHYGFRIGDTIQCTADKFTSEGYYFLEPENPWYKTGEIYEFRIIELHKLNFSDGSVQDVLVLNDPFGEEVKVFVTPVEVEALAGKTWVKCLLQRVRKSRLELELI